MELLGQSSLILSVSSFALAISSLSRNLNNRLIRSFAKTCLLISAWAFSFFLEKIFLSGYFYQVHMVLHVALAPVGLRFIKVLTRTDYPFQRWLERLVWVYIALLFVLSLTYIKTNPYFYYLVFLAPTFLVAACCYLMFVDWQIKAHRFANQKTPMIGLDKKYYIYIGAIILLLTGSMDHFDFIGQVTPSISNILMSLYLFLVSEAIIHQRLLNLNALLSRVAVYGFISICLTLVYAVLVGWVENSPALFILNTFVASLIILVMVEPLRKLTHFAVTKMFSQSYLSFEREVAQSQSLLTRALDSNGLAAVCLSFLERVLAVQSATFYLLRADGSKYRRTRRLGDESASALEVLATHPVVEFFQSMKKRGEIPIILDSYLEHEVERSTSAAQREVYELVLQGMRGLNANIAIPLMDNMTVLGFIALYAERPPDTWRQSFGLNNWGVLPVLYPFFLHAARTLKNMDVYVRLREKERLATLGEMSAGLAHEIRNPLGAIKGATQVLQSSIQDAETMGTAEGKLFNVIIEEVDRLNGVVTQFLDYSKPLQPNSKKVSLRFLLERLVDLYSTGTRYRVELDLTPEALAALPEVVCDLEKIKQVIVNLVQNALVALDDSAAAIEDRVVRLGAYVLSEKKQVAIYVEDNGKGIPRENLDRIFIPFFTTSPSGTGLGLSICSKIIESHGGHIEVQSDGYSVGMNSEFDLDYRAFKLTRFTIFLPI